MKRWNAFWNSILLLDITTQLFIFILHRFFLIQHHTIYIYRRTLVKAPATNLAMVRKRLRMVPSVHTIVCGCKWMRLLVSSSRWIQFNTSIGLYLIPQHQHWITLFDHNDEQKTIEYWWKYMCCKNEEWAENVHCGCRLLHVKHLSSVYFQLSVWAHCASKIWCSMLWVTSRVSDTFL